MRATAFFAAVVLALAPGFAGAQEDEGIDLTPLTECVAEQGGVSCIGLAARTCVERDGPMSVGICTGEENAWWLGTIAATTVRLGAREAEVIDLARQRGWPSPVPTLADINARHDAYRDARCAWRMAAWDGIHAGFEGIDCEMRLNAAHALWLLSLVEGA